MVASNVGIIRIPAELKAPPIFMPVTNLIESVFATGEASQNPHETRGRKTPLVSCFSSW
jgi:hypothetical protein